MEQAAAPSLETMTGMCKKWAEGICLLKSRPVRSESRILASVLQTSVTYNLNIHLI